jgi:predicted Kef-type K+ transport protein
MTTILGKIKALLLKEPVAVWGALLGIAASIALGLGVDPALVGYVVAGLNLVGIPVIRSQVVPLKPLQALADAVKVVVPKVAP